jgi:hypothetical protein
MKGHGQFICFGSKKKAFWALNALRKTGNTVRHLSSTPREATPLPSKPVTTYHYTNGVRYDDVTAITETNGLVIVATSFVHAAQRTYYATFAGDSSYQASTGNVLTSNFTWTTCAKTDLNAAESADGL